MKDFHELQRKGVTKKGLATKGLATKGLATKGVGRPAPIALAKDRGDGYTIRSARPEDEPRVREWLHRTGQAAAVWVNDQADNPEGLGMQLAFQGRELVGWLAITLLPGRGPLGPLRVARVDGTWIHPNHRHGVGGGGLRQRLTEHARIALVPDDGEELLFIRQGGPAPSPLQDSLGWRSGGPLWSAIGLANEWAGGPDLQEVLIESEIGGGCNVPDPSWKHAFALARDSRRFGVCPRLDTLRWRQRRAAERDKDAPSVWVSAKPRGDAWATAALDPSDPTLLWVTDWWVSHQRLDWARQLWTGLATVARERGASRFAFLVPGGSPWLATMSELGLQVLPTGRYLEWACPGPGSRALAQHQDQLWIQPSDWGWL